MGKKCFKCGVKKPLTEFYKHPATGDGHLNKCKECTKKDTSEHSKKTGYDKYRQRYSIKRIFNHRYRGMKQRIEGKATRKYPVEGKELLSKEEFYNWCYDSENLKKFNLIYNKWKESGFKRMYSPSINRIDDSKGYSLENIEWLSLSDNMKEYYKNGAIHSKRKTERDKKGRFIKKN